MPARTGPQEESHDACRLPQGLSRRDPGHERLEDAVHASSLEPELLELVSARVTAQRVRLLRGLAHQGRNRHRRRGPTAPSRGRVEEAPVTRRANVPRSPGARPDVAAPVGRADDVYAQVSASSAPRRSWRSHLPVVAINGWKPLRGGIALHRSAATCGPNTPTADAAGLLPPGTPRFVPEGCTGRFGTLRAGNSSGGWGGVARCPLVGAGVVRARRPAFRFRGSLGLVRSAAGGIR